MPGPSSLEAVYAEPTPRQRPTGLPPQLEGAFHRALHSELNLLRIVAAVAGVSYPIFVGLSRSNAARLIDGTFPLTPWTVVALVVLGLSAVFLLSAALVHSRRYYYAVFRGTFVAFSALLAIHIGFRVMTGTSPLQVLYLGDYAGLPAAVLVAAAPAGAGTFAALTMLSVAVSFNTLAPPDSLFYLLVEIGHAWLLMGPFLFMIARCRQISHRLDATAAAEYRSAVATANSSLLGELENRFLSHVHDTVLADLRAVAAGTLPVDELEESTRLELPDSRSTAVTAVVKALREVVREAAPGAELDVRSEIPISAVMPTDAAAAIIDCVREALSNSRRHAPDANCRAVFEWDGRLRVTVSDDGPGFDPSQIPTDRAGVRISILRRPRNIPGVSVDLDTAPGRGTRVDVKWDRSTASTETAAPDAERRPLPSAQETLGIDTLFLPATAVAAFTVFVGLGLLNEHSGAWGHFIAGLALTAVALALLCRVAGVRLDLAAAYGVSACTFAVIMLGQFAPFPTAPEWPYRWYVPVGLLLCAYLALRARPWFAWGTWLAATAATAVLQATDASPLAAEASSAEWLLNQASLLVPASFIPVLLGRLLRALPLLERASRDEFLSLNHTLTGQHFLRQWGQWLRRQIRVVIDDATPHCASIMEKRLRDAIRSPLLDTPAVTVAVWEARTRGAQVKLIDDRSPATADPAPHRELKDRLISTAAELADGDALTVRLLPPGRRTYATLVAELGDGEARRVSVPVTH